MNIVKKNPEQEYWPRLTKDKIKNSHIQIDWSKWVDEDEENEAKPMGDEWDGNNMNDFGMGGAGMGGFGGEGDSDDEEEEEEEGAHGHVHGHGHEHVHGENCNHEHEQEAPKKNADLGDLDAEAE